MIRQTLGLSISIALVVSSCGSLGTIGERNTSANTAGTSAAQVTEAPDVQALGKASLPSGDCGMLLWALEAGDPVLVFRAIRGKGAEMIVEGVETDLVLVQEFGDARFGISSGQEYAEADTVKIPVKVTIDTTFGMPFENGIYIEKGLITLVNNQGWERVIPVAGLAGCRS